MIDKVITLIKKFSTPYKEKILTERGWYDMHNKTLWNSPKNNAGYSLTLDEALEREFKCLHEKVESLTKEK